MSGINWDSGADISVQVNQRALIDKILARYSGEFTIFRELLQNADDAGAKTVKIRFESDKKDGQKLNLADLKHTSIVKYVLLNDGIPFREQDWDRLRKIAEGNPNEDKIGAFGVGFYALFSVTEQPMVVSGDRWMGFYWKDGGDQLYARTGERNVTEDRPSGTGNPCTSFTMDLRTPTPLDQPLDFARFLITSLTFMHTIRRIEMYVDEHEMLTIDKDVGGQESLEVAHERARESQSRGFWGGPAVTKETGSTSPGGIMRVHDINSTTVKISASVMRALLHSGYTPPPLPPVPTVTKLTNTSAGGWGAMLQSASSLWSRSATPAPPTANQPEPVPQPKPRIVNLEEKLPAARVIRVIGTDVECTVAGQFATELERATKKAAPRRTKVQLIYSEPHEEEDLEKGDGGEEGAIPTAGSIFSGIQPPLHESSSGNAVSSTTSAGRIFIGQPTAQTTGLGGHVSARFIPTVERESVDLQDRWVSIWNKELLWAVGWLARGVYSVEMERFRRLWISSGPEESVSTEVIKAREKIVKQAIHLLRFFTFHQSTPSGLVSTHIESAFFATHVASPLQIISTRGPLPVTSVRMPHLQLTPWLPSVAVLLPALAKRADEEPMVARLRERGLLKDIGLDDVVDALERSPLDEDKAVGLIRWWISMTKNPAFDGRLRAKVLNAAVLRIVASSTVSDGERIVRLADIQTWLNPATIPTEMPLPNETLPYAISKQIGNPTELAFAFDWHELGITDWVRYLVSIASMDSSTSGTAPMEHDLARSAPFVEKVLATVARSWNKLSVNDKEGLKISMNKIACLPTRTGFAKPQDAYFSDVDLFPDSAIIDLPSLAIKGPLRAMLTALGVRSHVELQLVFSRLVGSQKWSCYELVKYLVSVKSTLTEHEMARLRKTQAFPVMPRQDAAVQASPEAKVIRRTPDMLYEPTEEHRNFGVEVLDWGHVWKPNSPEAQFAFSLGIKRHVSLPALLAIAADPTDTRKRSAAFAYLLKYLAHYQGFSAVSHVDFAFVPAIAPDSGTKYLAKPSAAFTNPAVKVMGFAVVDSSEVTEDVATKLKLLRDPPVSDVARKVIDSPPLDVEQCIKYLEYMSTRLGDFYRDPAKSLTKLSNIPFIRVRDTRNPKKIEVILCRPNEVFFRPQEDSSTSSNLYSVYQRVFLYVDYGSTANAFLEACGVKRQPSIEQLAGLIVGNPEKFLALAQTKDLYLAQLRILATSYATFASDLKRQMVRSAFLLASHRVSQVVTQDSKQPLGVSAPGNTFGDDDDTSVLLEYDLAKPKEICIIDDPHAYSLFAGDIKAAPQEDMLEEFYMKLGSQTLTSLIKEEYRSSGTPIANASATSLRKLVLERLALFYSDRTRSNAEVGLDWLKKDKNFAVYQVSSINLKRTLKQGLMERTNTQAVSACVLKGRGGLVNLYISQSVELDMFEVALALVKALFKKVRPDDPLLLMTILSTPLAALKRRGYNVDRILNQQKAERLAREAEYQDKQGAALEGERNGRESDAVPSKYDAVPSKGTPSGEKQPGNTSRKSGEHTRIPSISSIGATKLSGTTLMNNLRQKFKSGSTAASGTGGGLSGGPETTPTPRPGFQPSPSPKQPSSEVTPFANIRDNALRAVAASRPDMSKDIVSEPQRSVVRESGDAYCDLTGVKTDLTATGSVPGTRIRLFVSRDIPDPEALMQTHTLAMQRFASTVVLPLAAIFRLDPSSISVFYDSAGPLIAFNRGGALYLNARYYLAWHDQAVMLGETQEAMISWFFSLAHELAHNAVADHNSEHEFYFSSICETFMMDLAKVLGNR